MYCHPIIEFQDKLYHVKRKIRESHNPIIDAWKTVTNSTTVLRKDGFYWFVEEIEEVEIDEFTAWADINVTDLVLAVTGSIDEPTNNLQEQ